MKPVNPNSARKVPKYNNFSTGKSQPEVGRGANELYTGTSAMPVVLGLQLQIAQRCTTSTEDEPCHLPRE